MTYLFHQMLTSILGSMAVLGIRWSWEDRSLYACPDYRQRAGTDSRIERDSTVLQVLAPFGLSLSNLRLVMHP